MIDDDIIQCKIVNYTNDRQYVNKFQHNLNIIFKHNKDLIGKRIEVLSEDVALKPKKMKKKPKVPAMNGQSTQRLTRLPKIDEFEKPKYIQVPNYNNYKYSSVFVNFIAKEDEVQTDLFLKRYRTPQNLLDLQKSQSALKKGIESTKQMPLHLRPFKRVHQSNASRERSFELNECTKQDLMQKNQEIPEYYNPDDRIHIHTVKSAWIKTKFDETLKRHYSQQSIETLEGASLSLYNQSVIMTQRFGNSDEIMNNNQVIMNYIKQLKQQSTNPNYLASKSRGPYKEYLAHKEYQVLVKNTQTYLRGQGMEDKMPRNKAPWTYLFVMRDAYNSFLELPVLTQTRILLALGLNPSNELEQVYWEQFVRFKQIVVENQGNLKQIVQFLVKFFEPEEQDKILLIDLISLITYLVQQFFESTDIQDEPPLIDLFTKNIHLSGVVQENNSIPLDRFEELFNFGIIDPYVLMEIILKNI